MTPGTHGTDHEYAAELVWEGNRGNGTADYASYGRQYRATMAGKPTLVGSADPTFRGDPALHNPEDLLVISLSSCHMLSYLALCARRRVRVIAYVDAARGRMRTSREGGGRFEEVVLRPRVTFAASDDLELARSLHEPAHRGCFIAASCNFPIRVDADVAHET
jgi:organic hydroperoxide reductase OsmC/OhrA